MWKWIQHLFLTRSILIIFFNKKSQSSTQSQQLKLIAGVNITPSEIVRNLSQIPQDIQLIPKRLPYFTSTATKKIAIPSTCHLYNPPSRSPVIFSDHDYFSVSCLVFQWNSRQNIAQKNCRYEFFVSACKWFLFLSFSCISPTFFSYCAKSV